MFENDKKPSDSKKRSKTCICKANITKKLTVIEVSKELNVTRGTVYEWLRKYREDPKKFMPGSRKQKQADAEVSKILRENKQLKVETDFLKKRRCTLRKATNKIHLDQRNR